MIVQSFKMAVKSIFANKVRSVLTVLGVVIGVIAIVVLVAIAQGSTAMVTSRIESLGTNLLSITIRTRGSVNPVTLKGLNELSQQAGIGEVAPLNRGSGTLKAGTISYEEGSIQGTTPSYMAIRNWSMAAGRFLQKPDLDNRSFVAVLGQDAARELYGDTNVVGERFVLNGYAFTVVGVLEEIGSSIQGSGDNQVLLPFTLSERLFKQTGVQSFFVSAADSQAVNAAQTTVTTWLSALFPEKARGSRQTSTPYTVYNQAEILNTLNATMGTMTLMLGGIAGISLFVGGIGIMNIMLVSVSERTREIGIRKAIGAARSNILLQFLIEALTVSLLGGLIGLALAAGITTVLEPVLQMKLLISPVVAGTAVGFSLLIGVVFGMYPANKASKLRPIDALRYEG